MKLGRQLVDLYIYLRCMFDVKNDVIRRKNNKIFTINVKQIKNKTELNKQKNQAYTIYKILYNHIKPCTYNFSKSDIHKHQNIPQYCF